MSRIRIVIDHLAFRGFDPAERNALIEGLRGEFLASAANRPAAMAHILEAAHQEAEKNGRPLAEAETRGWV